MNRYLLNISYIGTNFRGLQKTVNKQLEQSVDTTTIQGCVDQALRLLRPINEIQTVLSSRTDAGVHALHSTIHVDLERGNTEPYNTTTVTEVLNRAFRRQQLPIRVLGTRRVPESFHCRYNALGRTYLYRIAVAKYGTTSDTDRLRNRNYQAFVPIEELDRCLFLHDSKFDVDRVQAAARMFIGRHDFRSFMSTSHEKASPSVHPMFTVRRIDEINIKPGKSLACGVHALCAEELYNYWNIEIKGRSFLYKQVRRIVGSLIALASGRITEKRVYEMLTVPSKHSWDPRILISPPFGLYLCQAHPKMSFLQQLQEKRLALQPTTTIVTTLDCQRFIESRTSAAPIKKLENSNYGFVVDTKPDTVAACILDNYLYLGSQDAVNVQNISTLRITHILSMGIEAPQIDTIIQTPQIKYIPCLDLPETQLFPSVVQPAVDFIEDAQLCKGSVMVHCNAGVSRSASVVIAYLMLKRNMSFEAAYALVKSKRPCIQPNAGFMRQLRDYK